jgi:hypothetical protein
MTISDDLKALAAKTEVAVEGVMKVEPTVVTIASMFVPGAEPILAKVQPMVLLAAPFVENALKELAAGNNGNVLLAFITLLQHLTAGQPNSPILAAPAAVGGNMTETVTNTTTTTG